MGIHKYFKGTGNDEVALSSAQYNYASKPKANERYFVYTVGFNALEDIENVIINKHELTGNPDAAFRSKRVSHYRVKIEDA